MRAYATMYAAAYMAALIPFTVHWEALYNARTGHRRTTL